MVKPRNFSIAFTFYSTHMNHSSIVQASLASSRRQFLGGSAAALSSLAFPFVAGRALANDAKNSETLKIGLVGCGGRGTGAAQQALTADYNTTLHAVADVLPHMAQNSLKMLGDQFAKRVNVPEDRVFIGLDGYQKVIEQCDVVLLASPPGFRPQHLKAAVEAGKHIFTEKPMAVDAAGYRVALEAVRRAKEKKLSVVAGFCWRYSPSRREAFKRLHNGDIGDLTGYYATYYAGPVKPMPPASERKPEWADVEWQIRNWYNFSWLSGDSLVEQAIHSVDKIAWAFKDIDPIACIATGGRQIPAQGGNIFDHFHVTYEYPNEVYANLGSRQIAGCTNETKDIISGSKGSLIIGKGANPFITGENAWRFRDSEKNMYQVEHDEFFASIRKGEPINDGEWMLHSTMLGILGRMAAYTGKRITWQEAIASEEDLAPDDLKWGDSFTPTPMPLPGQKA